MVLVGSVRLAEMIVATYGLLMLVTSLWDRYTRRSRDATCDAPLPPGDSGWPIVGETIPFVIDVSNTAVVTIQDRTLKQE